MLACRRKSGKVVAHVLLFTEHSIADWARLERELREWLHSTDLGPEAVQRIVARTERAYNTMRPPSLTIDPVISHQVARFEIFHQDFREAQARMLTLLVQSFAALELSSR